MEDGMYYLQQSQDCLIVATYVTILKKLHCLVEGLLECDDIDNEDVTYMREDCKHVNVEENTSILKEKGKWIRKQ